MGRARAHDTDSTKRQVSHRARRRPTRAQLQRRLLIAEAQIDAARSEIVALREAQTDAAHILAEAQQTARKVLDEAHADAARVLANARQFIETELRIATAEAVLATERLHALAKTANQELRPDAGAVCDAPAFDLDGGRPLRRVQTSAVAHASGAPPRAGSSDVAASTNPEPGESLRSPAPAAHSIPGAANDAQLTTTAARIAELQSAIFGPAVPNATADPDWPTALDETRSPPVRSAGRGRSVEHAVDGAGIDDDFWERARTREPRRRRHGHRLLFGVLGLGAMVGLSTASVALAVRI